MGSMAPGKITVSRTVSTGSSSRESAGFWTGSSGSSSTGMAMALFRFKGPHGGGGIAAIHGNHLAGDVIGAASREEHGQRRDVLRRPRVRIRLAALQPVPHGLRFPDVPVQVRYDESRQIGRAHV